MSEAKSKACLSMDKGRGAFSFCTFYAGILANVERTSIRTDGLDFYIAEMDALGMAHEESLCWQLAPHGALRIIGGFFVGYVVHECRKGVRADATFMRYGDVSEPYVLYGMTG